MMIGLQIRALTSSPSCQTSRHWCGAPEGGEAPGLVQVLRDPYEWKSAVGLALAVFVASLALAPAPAVDHKKFAAEINTKTLKAAAAVKISTRFAASRPKQSGK
jgi:hypothetical protein